MFHSTVIIENRWEEILERSCVAANAVVLHFSPCGATCPGSSPTTCLQGRCSGPFATDLWTTSWNKWKQLNSYYTVLNINQLICIGVTKLYNITQLIICIGVTKLFSSAGVCNAHPTLTIQIKSCIVMTDYCILCHTGKWQLGVGHLPNELRASAKLTEVCIDVMIPAQVIPHQTHHHLVAKVKVHTLLTVPPTVHTERHTVASVRVAQTPMFDPPTLWVSFACIVSMPNHHRTGSWPHWPTGSVKGRRLASQNSWSYLLARVTSYQSISCISPEAFLLLTSLPPAARCVYPDARTHHTPDRSPAPKTIMRDRLLSMAGGVCKLYSPYDIIKKMVCYKRPLCGCYAKSTPCSCSES